MVEILYLLERKDKNGFTERIYAHQRCHGWHTIKKLTQHIRNTGIISDLEGAHIE